MAREQSSFFHFSDQLRLQATNFSNLSIGDTIWSTAGSGGPAAALPSDLVVNGWKTCFATNQKLAFGNSCSANRYNNDYNPKNSNFGVKDQISGGIIGEKFFNDFGSENKFSYSGGGYLNSCLDKGIGKQGMNGGIEMKMNDFVSDGSGKKKNLSSRNNNNSNNYVNCATEKKQKTLPASEALPRNEAIGGYIFVCNNDTMDENLKRELFGLPPRYRDSVRAITPGLPLFLYNYSTHQLHGIFEAASFGGTNIDPSAWEDKKCPGSSRFPSQVRVVTRKICDPLEEDAFRPILHHYDGPKFRLELNIEEALQLLDIFAEKNAASTSLERKKL